MCTSIKIINQTKNGILTRCEKIDIIQLVFNNLCFEFYNEEYLAFVDYINDFDADKIEKMYHYSIHDKKIPISVGHVCLTVLVNKEELTELKFLLTGKKDESARIFSEEIPLKFSRN
ncbi:MAG: DUF6686 family protein [Cellulophaga sp.]